VNSPPPTELVSEETASKVPVDDSAKLDGYADRILKAGGPRAIRVRETSPFITRTSVVFFARHEDAVELLTDENRFSVKHYTAAYDAIAPRGARLLMHQPDEGRTERYAILRSAAAQTPWFQPDTAALRAVAANCVGDLLAAFRSRESRQFDVIGDYGYFVPYLVGLRFLGLPGPQSWDLFARLACLIKNPPQGRRFTPETAPFRTQFIWSQLIFAQLFTDFENRDVFLRFAARYTEARLRAHIRDRLQYSQYREPRRADQTLLSALLSAEVRTLYSQVSDDRYAEHVLSLMLELMGTAQTIPGLAFGGIIKRWDDENLGFEAELRDFTAARSDAFVDESLRLSPPARYLLRTALEDTAVGGVAIRKGEYVCALVAKAATDPRVIKDGVGMDLARSQAIYLHFGPEGGPHRCFGWHVARVLLGEMFAGLKTLPGLERIEKVTGKVPERQIVRFAPGGGGAPGLVPGGVEQPGGARG
jgi:cytochrome P450